MHNDNNNTQFGLVLRGEGNIICAPEYDVSIHSNINVADFHLNIKNKPVVNKLKNYVWSVALYGHRHGIRM